MDAGKLTYWGATGQTITALDADGYIIFLSISKGQWMVGEPAIAAVWDQLESGVDLDTAITNAAEGWVDPDRLRADVQRQVPKLLRAGILSTTPPRSAPPRLSRIVADTQPSRRDTVDVDPRPPRRLMIAAAVGLVAGLTIQLLPFWLQLEILMAVRRIRPNRPGVEEAKLLVAAVKRAARPYPGWADCLEQSAGAFFAGALLGAAPDWCIGGHASANIYHAWVQADGVAVDYVQPGGAPIAMIRILGPPGRCERACGWSGPRLGPIAVAVCRGGWCWRDRCLGRSRFTGLPWE
jgi:hypothetical protein